jgi:hypothetical protein
MIVRICQPAVDRPAARRWRAGKRLNLACTATENTRHDRGSRFGVRGNAS